MDFELTSNIYFSLCPFTFGEEGFRFLEVVLVYKVQGIAQMGRQKLFRPCPYFLKHASLIRRTSTFGELLAKINKIVR